MSRLLALVLATCAALALTAAASASVTVRSVDTSSYPMISLTAVSSAQHGRAPVVRENGVRAVGLDTVNLGDDKAIVVAVDRSRSMRGEPIAHAALAVRQFVSSKSPSDRLAIVGFASEALVLTQFSQATIDAEAVLRTLGVDRRQGTALYDAVVLSSARLRAEPSQARVLVLLTDGADFRGRASLAQAIAAARSAGVAVYAVGISSSQFNPAPMQRLTRETGGRFYQAASAQSLAAVYKALGSELERTWRLSYATAARPGAKLELDVRQAYSGRATANVVLPGETRVERPSGLASVVDEGWTAPLIVLAAGALLFVALRLAFRPDESVELRRRVGSLDLESGEGAAEEAEKAPSLRQRFRALALVTERRFGRGRRGRQLERLLVRAAVPLRTGELFYVMVGSGLGLALVARTLGFSLFFTILAFAVGVAAPVAVIARKARRRARAFDEQLPDLLAAVAASLRAGLGLKQALQSISGESEPPASVEFGRVLAEARLGMPLGEALESMCERIGSDDLEYVTTAITVQDEVGGSLAGLFDLVSDTVRERQQHARKVRSLTAMGRASAYVLVALPFGLAALITLINADYMEPLYTTSLGHFLMVLAIVMIGVGSLLLKKIVTIRA